MARKYDDFQWLYTELTQAHPECIVPKLPAQSKSTYATFSAEVVDQRLKQSLERFLAHIIAHPVLGKSTVLQEFLEAGEVVRTRSSIVTVVFARSGQEQKGDQFLQQGLAGRQARQGGGLLVRKCQRQQLQCRDGARKVRQGC
jgi:hypothetical protein